MSTKSIHIRVATVCDVDCIKACARDAYAKYVSRIGRPPAPMVANFADQVSSGIVTVAVHDSSLAGFVVFYPEGDHIHLENVAVSPGHAGKGIGRKLIEHVEATAREAGLVAVELYTNAAMTENLVMYPKLGYLETGKRREDGFDRVFFRKPV